VIFRKFLTGILLIGLALIVLAYLTGKFTSLSINIADLAILTLCFTVISIVMIVIFIKGLSKEPEDQTIYSLAALGVKIFLEMALVLVWLIIAKKTGGVSVVLFFVLYLAISLYSILFILKTLKKKSL
jgi:hypothetical protein